MSTVYSTTRETRQRNLRKAISALEIQRVREQREQWAAETAPSDTLDLDFDHADHVPAAQFAEVEVAGDVDADCGQPIQEPATTVEPAAPAAEPEPELYERVLHDEPNAMVIFDLPRRLAWTLRKLGFSEFLWQGNLELIRSEGDQATADTLEGNVDELRAYLAKYPPAVIRTNAGHTKMYV